MRSWSVVFQKEIASTVSPMAGGNPYPWALSFSDSFQFIPHAESLFKLISFLTFGIRAEIYLCLAEVLCICNFLCIWKLVKTNRTDRID